MRLSPNESSINQSDLVQTPQLPQTNSQKLSALELSQDPRLRRVQIPLTLLAEIDRGLFGNALCDVYGVAQARDAEIGRVGWNGSSTIGTKDETLCCLRGILGLQILHYEGVLGK